MLNALFTMSRHTALLGYQPQPLLWLKQTYRMIPSMLVVSYGMYHLFMAQQAANH
jgi:hypothetical protein